LKVRCSKVKNFTYAYILKLNMIIFTEKYSRRDLHLQIPRWQREIQFLIKILILAGITNSIFAAILLAQYPKTKVFLVSVIFPERFITEEKSYWLVFLIGGLLNFWIFLTLWSYVFAFASIYLTFIYAQIFVLQEML